MSWSTLQVLSAKLMLDCMGHGSPIVRQLRWGVRPDGVCLVVGGLARGFAPEQNKTSDVIFTAENSDLQKSLQYFWEAFPAGTGPTDRTTYMFSYLVCDPEIHFVSINKFSLRLIDFLLNQQVLSEIDRFPSQSSSLSKPAKVSDLSFFLSSTTNRTPTPAVSPSSTCSGTTSS